MTPIFFRSKSPMLRVIANLPLTFGCPRLFQVIKPPLFFTLKANADVERNTSTLTDPKSDQRIRGDNTLLRKLINN